MHSLVLAWSILGGSYTYTQKLILSTRQQPEAPALNIKSPSECDAAA